MKLLRGGPDIKQVRTHKDTQVITTQHSHFRAKSQKMEIRASIGNPKSKGIKTFHLLVEEFESNSNKISHSNIFVAKSKQTSAVVHFCVL